MARHADLFGNGVRLPKQFHQQVLRLTGDISLNVFATINNRLILAGGDARVHEGFERTFLNDSTRNKLRRLREREPDDVFHVVFTRLGALLVLKVLLGTSRAERPPKPTAVGASALHANDYLESPDCDLSHGLLPVVAEYAGTWEVQNPRNVGVLLRRINYIYSDMLLSDDRLCTLAANRLGCRLADVKFAGLEYERYLALLVGIYTTVKKGVTEQATSVVDIDNLRTRAGFSTLDFEHFVADRSDTLDRFGSDLGRLDDPDVFGASVASAAWCSDLRLFRKKPLLRLGDGRFVVLDMQFLIENASAGLYWHLASNFSKGDREILFSYWGTLFEMYVQRLVRHYAGTSCQAGVRLASTEVDIMIAAESDVVLIEIKAGVIAQDIKGSRDQQALDAELRQKYVETHDGRPKGLTQLARAAHDLLYRESCHSSDGYIYPILVVEDPALQTWVMNSYLDQIFGDIKPGARVKPLTILLVDELEELLPHIYAGDASWQELLDDRFINSGVSVDPMHTSFVHFARRRKLRRRPDTFLEPRTEELNRIIAEQYADFFQSRGKSSDD